jgi:selenocysteine-specific elongation factor
MDYGLVIGTAGHIDHGKTTLVRALTGTHLDTLPEEQERGITIALGFAPLDLADGRRVGFVDVPGHERLVRTMIAGVTGIDAVLLCVSAVDGAMPQTREHLAILQLLGVPAGAVVVTMADLVDEEMLELAVEDARDAVAGTFLEGAPVIATSSVEGTGLDALREHLATLSPRPRQRDAPFRMPVDRAFSRQGFGTVATGTTWSGSLPDGATVRLLPGDDTARVRGIEVHGEAVAVAEPGRRTALNLSGIETSQVPRGTVVAGDGVPCPHMIDVRYHHLDGAPTLSDGDSVRVLLGTAERIGRIVLADVRTELPGGATAYAQLRVDAPLPCLPGDRFVLRRTSPVDTLGGGEVLDPWAPKLRRKRREAVGKELARLDGGDATVWLLRAGEEGLAPSEWAARAGDREAARLGGRCFAPTVVARLTGALLEALTAFHQSQPLALGAHRRELHRGRLGHLDERVFDAVLQRLSEQGAVQIDGALVRATGFAVALDDEQARLADAVVASVEEAGLEGLRPKPLHTAHPEPEVAALLRVLEREGRIRSIDKVGWVVPSTIEGLHGRLRDHFGEHDELPTGTFKELTGLTRRAAIPWLEWLDAQGLTRREGDTRRPGPRL